MERLKDGLPGAHESLRELAEHSLTHDDVPADDMPPENECASCKRTGIALQYSMVDNGFYCVDCRNILSTAAWNKTRGEANGGS